MKLNNFIEGLKIFQRYSKDKPNSEFFIGSEYSEFYVNVNSILITEEDKENLVKLGWVEDKNIWIASLYP